MEACHWSRGRRNRAFHWSEGKWSTNCPSFALWPQPFANFQKIYVSYSHITLRSQNENQGRPHQICEAKKNAVVYKQFWEACFFYVVSLQRVWCYDKVKSLVCMSLMPLLQGKHIIKSVLEWYKRISVNDFYRNSIADSAQTGYCTTFPC